MVTQSMVFCKCSQGLWQGSTDFLHHSVDQPDRGDVAVLSQGVHRCCHHLHQMAQFGAARLSEIGSQAGRLQCLNLNEVVNKQRFLKQMHAWNLIAAMPAVQSCKKVSVQ